MYLQFDQFRIFLQPCKLVESRLLCGIAVDELTVIFLRLNASNVAPVCKESKSIGCYCYIFGLMLADRLNKQTK